MKTSQLPDDKKAEQQQAQLTSELATARERLRTYDLRRVFIAEAAKQEIEWASPLAIDDAFTLARPILAELEIEENGEVSDQKVLREAVKKVLEGREYLTKQRVAPDNDATKRSQGTRVPTMEEAVARKVNQQHYPGL